MSVHSATPRSTVTLFAISSLIWGSTWLAIKFQLDHVSPDVSVAYRFTLAAMLLAIWCSFTRRSLRFDARSHTFIALQGVLMFGFNYVAVYWAERYAKSGLVAILFSTIVFMVPLGARWVFGTPIAPRMLVAALLGIIGVTLLFVPELMQGNREGDTALGIALGLGATVIAAGGNLAAMRNQRRDIPLLAGTTWGMTYGALAAGLIAVAHGATWSFDARVEYVLSLFYLAIFGSVAAFLAYLTLLHRAGPALASYVGVTTPVIAMMFSTAFEGYRWTPLAVVGVALAVIGNWLALKPRGARPESRTNG